MTVALHRQHHQLQRERQAQPIVLLLDLEVGLEDVREVEEPDRLRRNAHPAFAEDGVRVVLAEDDERAGPDDAHRRLEERPLVQVAPDAASRSARIRGQRGDRQGRQQPHQALAGDRDWLLEAGGVRVVGRAQGHDARRGAPFLGGHAGPEHRVDEGRELCRAPDSAFDSSPSLGVFAARQMAAMKSLSGETSGSVTLIGWSVGVGDVQTVH